MTEQGIPPAKVIMMGESSVGKSSIIYRFSKDEFDELGTPTIGACYITKVVEVDGKKIALHVWDTAGQERFRSIIPMYLRGSLAVLYVCAADNPESVQRLEEWRKVVMNTQPETKVSVIVYNKSDISNQALYQQTIEFAQRYDYEFMATSAKTNANIHELFELVAKRIIERTDITKLEVVQQTLKPSQPKKQESSCC